MSTKDILLSFFKKMQELRPCANYELFDKAESFVKNHPTVSLSYVDNEMFMNSLLLTFENKETGGCTLVYIDPNEEDFTVLNLSKSRREKIKDIL